MYTNLVLIGLFVFKILSKNLILKSIKSPNSVANLPKFELIQAFMHVLHTCKNEEDPIKNEGSIVFTSLRSVFNLSENLYNKYGLALHTRTCLCKSSCWVQVHSLNQRVEQAHEMKACRLRLLEKSSCDIFSVCISSSSSIEGIHCQI